MDAANDYEIHARDFLRGRDKSSIGAQVVERWSRTLRSGATVIELACGGGYPVTRVLAAAGLQLWAVDGSPTLVSEFRSRFPSIPVECARVQESDFFGRKFDAAIAIGLLFLLPEPDQAALISRISELLVPGGRFLFTAPIEIGTWNDMNTGLACRSLGRERYEGLLRNASFRVVATHTDEGANNYYEAEKVA
jgi:cyclopropane fatty-acyl-phospholipid synthase-like methyltransferase